MDGPLKLRLILVSGRLQFPVRAQPRSQGHPPTSLFVTEVPIILHTAYRGLSCRAEYASYSLRRVRLFFAERREGYHGGTGLLRQLQA